MERLIIESLSIDFTRKRRSVNQRELLIVDLMRLLNDALFVDPTSADEDLVDGGMIDSFGFMELFVNLEERFGIQIGIDDLDLDHFRTVERIASFVLDKQKEAVEP